MEDKLNGKDFKIVDISSGELCISCFFHDICGKDSQAVKLIDELDERFGCCVNYGSYHIYKLKKDQDE